MKPYTDYGRRSRQHSRWRDSDFVIPLGTIFVLAVFGFVAYLAWKPDFPFLQTDSDSYIKFDPMRTAGYPMFLAFVEEIFGTLRAAVTLQLLAMVGAAAYLAAEIRYLTRSTLTAIAALVLTLANFFIYRYAFTIMSEALFFSALGIFAGLICRINAAASFGALTALSATVGVAILIRPVAYVLIPVLIVVAVLSYARLGRWRSVTLLLTAPLAVLLTAGALTFYVVHGSFGTQSFLGHNLIGKIAYLPGDGVETRYPEIKHDIENYMVRLRGLHPGNLHDRFLLQEPQYDFVRYGLTTPTVDRIATGDGIRPDQIRKEVALAYIGTHPLTFAEEVGLQLYSLWTVADLRTEHDNARFSQFVAALPIDPFTKTTTPKRSSIPALVVYGIRAFMLTIFMISLFAAAVSIAAFVRRKTVGPIWTTLALMSLFLNGYLCLVATLQVGIFRYLIVAWPVIITIGVLFGHIILVAVFGRDRADLTTKRDAKLSAP